MQLKKRNVEAIPNPRNSSQGEKAQGVVRREANILFNSIPGESIAKIELGRGDKEETRGNQ